MDWDLSGNRRTLKSKVKSYKEHVQHAERSVRGRSTHDDDCCVEIPRGGNFDQVTGSRNRVAFALVQLWHTHTHSCGKQRHVWQIHINTHTYTLLWQTHKSTQNKHLLVEVRFGESPLEKNFSYQLWNIFRIFYKLILNIHAAKSHVKSAQTYPDFLVCFLSKSKWSLDTRWLCVLCTSKWHTV